ncbi:3-isopropylmalate dehydrogenase [bacterium]|nr:3-isopropylmalate dehydrogenase [bacterium]MBT3581185.1 3-isopropylmalate dehydrogenase [bacterium]MBT4551902.1 3-isopropylmalate dehydrogenase [bacterium]MBT7087455.1 3-isopropylmalate dehydrogenase [bacterium]
MLKKYHNIALIPGDLNGVTVTEATLEVVEALKKSLEKPIKHTRYDYNATYFNKHKITTLGENELGELEKYDQIFLGAVGDPKKIKPGIVEAGILLKVRQYFDQYVNLRPVILPEGVPTILKDKTYKDINFEICRENSEGLYIGAGWIEKEGTEEEAGYQVMKCTYKGVKRLAEFAVKRAIARKKAKKPKLHMVFKTNVLTYAAHPWNRVFEEFRTRKDIDVYYMHIDNFMMQMLIKPEQFDVVITENMFGDISTDAGAVIQGGIGSAVSGNINPEGIYPSMFEPIHGSSPDKWYNSKGQYDAALTQLVKPEAAFFSYAMMLEQMGEGKAAKLLKEAALANIKDPNYQNMKLKELIAKACVFVKKN